MRKRIRASVVLAALIVAVGVHHAVLAQTETATLSGRVSDPQGKVVPGAQVEITNVDTGIKTSTTTNDDGLYVVPNLRPGRYRIIVRKDGFKEIVKPDVVLHVQDTVALNFGLEVGSVTQSVTVTGGAPLVNTESATVSTVVDRQFAENLPLNGRSFQTLIDLTPGVVVTSAGLFEQGQFSVNGQRADANYFTVDGASANFGIPTTSGGLAQSAAGSVPSLSVFGSTNGLVSVDAMQEFRIQTSTYAPEFGRTPGAQISIVTRSGTNQFHGAVFDYLRNDILNANDWFANQLGLRKATERQNDFGGVFGGPIIKDRTFFFFSYEGFRLRLPQTANTTVPSLSARQSAPASIQPFLNAFPIPNGPDFGNGQARFSAAFSDQASLDSYSLRLDQSLTNRINLFGRYSYSPSDSLGRGQDGFSSPNGLTLIRGTTQFVTLGTTWGITTSLTNDLRFNYSRSSGTSRFALDTFAGAIVPADSTLFIAPFSSGDSTFVFDVFAGQQLGWALGSITRNLQRQINVIDNLSLQKGLHSIKWGIDYRWIGPIFAPQRYGQTVFFSDVPSVIAGQPLFAVIQSGQEGTVNFHNFSAFVQDTWKARPRLTLTYGLRWEVNPPPSGSLPLLAVTGFNSFSTLALAPPGKSLWNTTYGNFAPRMGVAYQLIRTPGRESVFRGGFGVFYDLSTQQIGQATNSGTPPFGAQKFIFPSTFPLTSTEAQPPSISSNPPLGFLVAFDPNLKLPYTLQWNLALEQALGLGQKISVSYIGAAGRRLLQEDEPLGPNSNFGFALLVQNAATSDYHSLQLQYERRFSRGLQALASYTFAHSIDTASSGSTGSQPPFASDLFVRALGSKANRGPSDFDIRHSFTVGLTYDIPTPRVNPWVGAILRDWAVQSIVLARSAPPVNVVTTPFGLLLGEFIGVRPDVVQGIPLYVNGSEFPGGKAINNTSGAVVGGCPDGSQSIGPFCPPPKDSQGRPLRQGNLGRNSLRGFGATQWDFAVHRDFPIRETLKLQFRAEMFNVLNHPNFGQPVPNLNNPKFGQSTQNLAQVLSGGIVGGGGFNPLYQIGGPRSMQFALKLMF